MQVTTIPFSKTGKISNLILDFISNSKNIDEFIGGESSFQGIKDKFESLSFSSEKRILLHDCIKEQYMKCGVELPENSSLLLKENTFTITTGHQLCLAGGPQYFIHKIVSVIKLCLQLKEVYPENNFVPVFWLASEDHDFEEINHINLFGKVYRADYSSSGPVGRLESNVFDEVMNQVEEVFGESENAHELKRLFKDYHSKNTLANTTRKWVDELFNKFGLVIIDGDDKRLKESFSSILKDELVRKKSVDFINESSKSLSEKGYHTQVNPREINLFYVEDGLRERIVFDSGLYKVLNTEKSFSEDEILKILEESPEKFSPNAVLRPVYEEFILPNIAYIGGPGEIAYWLQLKTNFERLKVSYPLLFIRDSFVVLNEKQVYPFLDLGFELEDVFLDHEELVKQYIKTNTPSSFSFDKEELMLGDLQELLLEKVKGIDNSLTGMIKAEMSKINKLFSKLESKLVKAEKQKEEVAINKIVKFKNSILPDDVLLERKESFIPNYIKYGKNYISALIACSDIFDPQLKIIVKKT